VSTTSQEKWHLNRLSHLIRNFLKELTLKLERPVILVTGAAGGGIGTEIIRTLADKYAVGVNGLHMDGILSVIKSCRLPDAHSLALQGDVSNADNVRVMVEALIERFGRIDALVCNAARGVQFCPTSELADSAWRDDLDIILSGSFYCVREAIPHMVKRKFGRIVFVSSSAALRGTWGRAVSYAAAKAGLHGMVRQLALELAAEGITVNAVAPSQIDTPRIRRGGRKDDSWLAQYAASTVPVGRVGRPIDVAELVQYLVSPLSSYVTGQIIEVDGGSSLAKRVM
jgi:NAD(P)-dependent dehydrogenase (short-subunit alcohol dehydrogenase family)